MAANKIVNLGPLALTTTTTTNLFSPPTTTGGTNNPENVTNTYYLIRSIIVVNKTGGAVTYSLWKDATGGNTAGKEVIAQGRSVAANSTDIIYPPALRLDAGDTNKFLVGGASANTSLTIMCVAEMGIS